MLRQVSELEEGHLCGTTYQAVRAVIAQSKLCVIHINPEVSNKVDLMENCEHEIKAYV